MRKTERTDKRWHRNGKPRCLGAIFVVGLAVVTSVGGSLHANVF